jgi:uncharacterized membrane protein
MNQTEARKSNWFSGLAFGLQARPRLVAGAVTMFAAFFALYGVERLSLRLILAWDAGVIIFASSVFFAWSRQTVDLIRRRAVAQDEGKNTILALTLLASIASIGAIGAELGQAKELAGAARFGHVGLTAATIILSWLFVQILFAQHYAHEYFRPKPLSPTSDLSAGLNFPGGEEPQYWDFFYFSAIIGTAFATADIDIESRTIRRIATVHTLIAFLFNTVILALSINLAAALF